TGAGIAGHPAGGFLLARGRPKRAASARPGEAGPGMYSATHAGARYLFSARGTVDLSLTIRSRARDDKHGASSRSLPLLRLRRSHRQHLRFADRLVGTGPGRLWASSAVVGS